MPGLPRGAGSDRLARTRAVPGTGRGLARSGLVLSYVRRTRSPVLVPGLPRGQAVTSGQDRPCTGYGPAGPCGATPARLYPAGWRCAAHTPAAAAGRPEPGAGRYCPPGICWCGRCPAPGAARRVLVTGSRTWTDEAVIGAALAGHCPPGTVLVTGACPRGADAIAARLWQARGGQVEQHPADWPAGRGAGFARNAAMVALGADACLAFIRDASPGASHAARLAALAGIPVHRYDHPRPEGQEQDKAPSGLTFEAAALGYIGRGWPVFVLGRSKRPVANCPACRAAGPEHYPAACPCLTCHGFHAATTSPARLAAMLAKVPRGLLAIRTGTASGLCVVDIDPRNGGQPDRALMTPTATVATGGGGWHLYYRHPGTPTVSALPDRAGVDIKGNGGYVVAPPSIHPRTGHPYRWAGQHPVNEMRPPLRAAVTRPPAPVAVSPQLRGQQGGRISSPAALLAALLNAVEHAPAGRRRVTLYGAARGAWRMV